MVWMLREIEIAALKPEHVQCDEATRRVTLTWPNSKTDQEGRSVSRALQCCGLTEHCDAECPFEVSMNLVTKVKKGGWTRCSFTSKGAPTTKAQLVGAWKELYGKGVSGHSARRSGALSYVQAGWAVAQVAYLGRWKSNVIYQYAEEALESRSTAHRSPQVRIPRNSRRKSRAGDRAGRQPEKRSPNR